MFGTKNTRRARPQTGNITPLKVPSAGLNARDTFAVMGPEHAISLINVIVEPYGLRTRKGYSEWAINLAGPLDGPVWTVMNYYPPTAVPARATVFNFFASNMRRMMVEPRAEALPPAGKLFASRGGKLYNVTAGGAGPWTAEAGVTGATDFWTWRNFTNLAGTFLVITNDAGGYHYYNGTTWTTPTMGTGAGQIEGVDPAKFCYVTEFKKRLWFIEKDSTRAWYLPVSQLAGKATFFDFGEQFRKGGRLQALESWSVDSGEDLNDMLVGVSSQGNVVIYKGNDPNTAADFQIHGVWDVGALPEGRRSVSNTGGDMIILSQFGATPLSALLSTTQLGAVEQKRSTYLVAPMLARLMRDYSTLPGWQIRLIPKEELLVIQVPHTAKDLGGSIFALKVTTGAWQILQDLPYVSFCNIDSAVFAGTLDGRVVRGFDGPLDNVLLSDAPDRPTGKPIRCQVTPAYQPAGSVGMQKVFKLVRPTFICTTVPAVRMQILTDYGSARPGVAPTLPVLAHSLWDQDRWDEAIWSGLQDPIHEWFGAHGVGFTGTVQLDYICGGDTLLASIDLWAEQGGVM